MKISHFAAVCLLRSAPARGQMSMVPMDTPSHDDAPAAPTGKPVAQATLTMYPQFMAGDFFAQSG